MSSAEARIRVSLADAIRGCLIVTFLFAGLAQWAPAAQALSFDLNIEFDEGVTGPFATVDVSEQNGALHIEIQLYEPLGPNADLHKFYFNLAGDFTGLTLNTEDDPFTPYHLRSGLPVAGGAGSSFDYNTS